MRKITSTGLTLFGLFPKANEPSAPAAARRRLLTFDAASQCARLTPFSQNLFARYRSPFALFWHCSAADMRLSLIPVHMSLSAIFIIRESVLRGIALAGGSLSVLVALLVWFTHSWSGDESRAILLVPFVYGTLFIGVATVFRGNALRVAVISVLVGFPALNWAGWWLCCATGLLSRAACN